MNGEDDDGVPDSLPSLEIAVDELRRRYDDEERRRITVETKLTGLIALNSILVSVIGLGFEIAFAWKVVAVLLLTASIVIALYQLRGHTYLRPVANIHHFSVVAQEPEEAGHLDFLDRYRRIIPKNREKTDARYRDLRIGVGLTLLGLGVYLVGSLGM